MNEHRELYQNGKVGDVAVKKRLVEVLNALIEPIRTRRKQYEQRPDDVLDALRQGTRRANAVAEETLCAGEEGDEAGLLPAGVDGAVNPLATRAGRQEPSLEVSGSREAGAGRLAFTVGSPAAGG